MGLRERKGGGAEGEGAATYLTVGLIGARELFIDRLALTPAGEARFNRESGNGAFRAVAQVQRARSFSDAV